jgi:hypothetical protein
MNGASRVATSASILQIDSFAAVVGLIHAERIERSVGVVV